MYKIYLLGHIHKRRLQVHSVNGVDLVPLACESASGPVYDILVIIEY